jgi:uncharacterized membrane protein
MNDQRTLPPQTSAKVNGEMVVEQNVYTDVYRLLIAGMILSNAFFLIGLILASVHPQYFSLAPEWVRQQYHWKIALHGLATGDPNTYVMIATAILILTPVARVIVSIYAFFVDRDFKFVAITGFVLLIMIVTVVFGFLGLK